MLQSPFVLFFGSVEKILRTDPNFNAGVLALLPESSMDGVPKREDAKAFHIIKGEVSEYTMFMQYGILYAY